MTLNLDQYRRSRLMAEVQGFFSQEFDEELSAFRAEQLVDFFLGTLGPHVYNQAVQDARGFMLKKLDDLDGEVHVTLDAQKSIAEHTAGTANIANIKIPH